MDYCSSLNVSLDFSCCDSICDVLRRKQLHSLNSSLLAKPFTIVSFALWALTWWRNKSFVWLKQHLHSETESIILAIQNQVIATRVIESKIMHKSVPSLHCRVYVDKQRKPLFICCRLAPHCLPSSAKLSCCSYALAPDEGYSFPRSGVPINHLQC